MRSSQHHTPGNVILSVLLALMATSLHAQPVYRIVAPDGRVTFSDKTPAAGEKATLMQSDNRTAAEAAVVSNLPFELQQAASRYPVTLYTTNACPPCDSGRSLLSRRGIPFVERTLNTAQDGEAFKRLGGESSLPFLTIGGQRLQGFSDTEWNQFLSAAGYPSSSQLPSSYRQPPATPLVSSQKPSVAPAPSQTPADTKPATTSPTNPAGIIF